MTDVLVAVTACSLLSAFVLFLLWRDALSDARYWQGDADYWFDAWTKASKGRPEVADCGGPGVSPGSKKGGGGG